MGIILLPYGARPIPWDTGSDSATVLRCKKFPALGDLTRALTTSLRQPIHILPLRELAAAAGRIAVIVSDATRLFPQGMVLRAVLDELSTVDARNITIVIANGSHEPGEPSSVGLDEAIASRYRIVNHDSRDSQSMVTVGVLPPRERPFFFRKAIGHIARSIRRAPRSARRLMGAIAMGNWESARAAVGYTMFGRACFIFGGSFKNTIRIRREVAEADLRILVGQIKPHFLAGFTGGLKALFPGCADRIGIAKVHFMMNHPTVRLGICEGNIIREQIDSAGRLCGESFAVNVVMNGDNLVVGVFAGDPVGAHRQGAELSRHIGRVTSARADIVIAAEGFPEAVNLYQLTKIVPPAARIVREGGAIICVGSCCGGIGESKIVNDITFKIGFWDLLPRGVKVYLVSDLPRKMVDRTEFIHSRTIDEAIARERHRFKGAPSITVLSGAGLLIPEAVDSC